MPFDEPTPFPNPASDFFPAPDAAPPPPPEATLTPAERKRLERAARREAGLPDPRVVDSAILAALIESLVKGGAAEQIVRRRSTDRVLIYLRPVLKGALNALVHDKGLPRHVAVQLVLRRLRLG